MSVPPALTKSPYQSWGLTLEATAAAFALRDRTALLPTIEPGTRMLAYGLGRSYGDSCLNDGGALLLTRGLDRFLAFDTQSGVIECEAGVSLAEMIKVALPRGFFLPVSPGTRWVTIGGAVANDVHGKNHHGAGTFGCHVRRLTLRRSDGSLLTCSPTENAALFNATIGGLGLTGLILTVELQLLAVESPYIASERVLFRNLDEFFDVAAASDHEFTHTVSWVDCLAHPGQGVFFRGRHADRATVAQVRGSLPRAGGLPLIVPGKVPGWGMSQLSVRVFNELYFKRQAAKPDKALEHYQPFFYPLDSMRNWNRLYGPKGFFQYQCVLPVVGRQTAMHEVMRAVSKSGEGSFLAVLKMFGDRPSPGLLSFPRPGVTLALDFRNRGARTLQLLERLDAIVRANGGAVYPAKDARMSGDSFLAYFPRLNEFLPHIDPGFSSSFWRRVTAGKRI